MKMFQMFDLEWLFPYLLDRNLFYLEALSMEHLCNKASWRRDLTCYVTGGPIRYQYQICTEQSRKTHGIPPTELHRVVLSNPESSCCFYQKSEENKYFASWSGSRSAPFNLESTEMPDKAAVFSCIEVLEHQPWAAVSSEGEVHTEPPLHLYINNTGHSPNMTGDKHVLCL